MAQLVDSVAAVAGGDVSHVHTTNVDNDGLPAMSRADTDSAAAPSRTYPNRSDVLVVQSPPDSTPEPVKHTSHRCGYSSPLTATSTTTVAAFVTARWGDSAAATTGGVTSSVHDHTVGSGFLLPRPSTAHTASVCRPSSAMGSSSDEPVDACTCHVCRASGLNTVPLPSTARTATLWTPGAKGPTLNDVSHAIQSRPSSAYCRLTSRGWPVDDTTKSLNGMDEVAGGVLVNDTAPGGASYSYHVAESGDFGENRVWQPEGDATRAYTVCGTPVATVTVTALSDVRTHCSSPSNRYSTSMPLAEVVDHAMARVPCDANTECSDVNSTSNTAGQGPLAHVCDTCGPTLPTPSTPTAVNLYSTPAERPVISTTALVEDGH